MPPTPSSPSSSSSSSSPWSWLRISKDILRSAGRQALASPSFITSSRQWLHSVFQLPAALHAMTTTTLRISKFNVTTPTGTRVRVERVAPDNANGSRILYFHGGAFVMGNAAMYRRLTCELAAGTKSVVYVPEYSLAPESRYPVALEELEATYNHLLHKHDDGSDDSEERSPKDFAFVGDSAGGNLAVASMLKMIVDNDIDRLPRCAVLMSPWLDLDASGPSHHGELVDRDPLIPNELIRPFGQLYRPSSSSSPVKPPYHLSYLSSPARVPMKIARRLPPTLIHVGSEEVLLSDSFMFADQAPTSTTVKVFPGMYHVFQLSAPFSLFAISPSSLSASQPPVPTDGDDGGGGVMSTIRDQMTPTVVSTARQSIREMCDFIVNS